jgi:hypothetical protein
MAEQFTSIPPTVRRYRAPASLLSSSAEALRTLGAGVRESVVLWQGKVLDEYRAEFTKLHVPRQVTGPLHFNVPLADRLKLLASVSADEEFILAQVHTHPQQAFHSAADDRLAITKHLGAISIVVPFFAMNWSGDLTETSVNVCLGGDSWREMSFNEIPQTFEVIA